MPDLLQFNPTQFLGFLLVFARISGVMLTAPILSDNNIPPQVKTAITFVLAMVFFPLVAPGGLGPDPDVLRVLVLSLGELGIGLLLGFIGRLLFTGVTLAGEIIGFQMGVGVANVFDPGSQAQVSIIGQVQIIFTLLLFVTLDGHHLFIATLAESYAIVPVGGAALGENTFQFVMGLAGNIFVMGLQLGAPLIVSLLAANFSIGLIARSVPQVNVFVVGFPFTIALGILLLALAFPFFMAAVARIHGSLQELLFSGLQSFP